MGRKLRPFAQLVPFPYPQFAGLAREVPKVSAHFRENSRFGETKDVGETRTFGGPTILMGYAPRVVVAVERRVSAATGHITVTKIRRLLVFRGC
jgi:hypothetical protein